MPLLPAVLYELGGAIPLNLHSRLLLIETIGTFTDHTPKDLAGWHVCLDVIEALLDGNVPVNRKPAWEEQYRKYSVLVEQYLNS
ncbi:hypothetical protein [Paenibacillus sp. FSL R7-0273]|uniref:hypothetical protein n=1 Tax=Paenibacillus sp. FSL R7-0273 TaxID=1536772 RepID=UPI0006938F61|nr:hypothetical protein [Paenibacillus sp. FSL R7-0273]OMF94723.1 hypothetical protein BK144_09395 [Paenibacillus sp. FSL R7-0273]